MSSNSKKVEIVVNENKRRVFKENGRQLDSDLDPITRGVIDSYLSLIIQNTKRLENATSKSERKEIADNIFALVKSVDRELEMDGEEREQRGFESVANENLKNNDEFEKLVCKGLSFRHPSLQEENERWGGLKNKSEQKDNGEFEQFKKPYEDEKERER